MRKREVSEQAILEAGYLSIARLGYHKTTFESIADISGFSQATVVKVFKSKRNIFPIVAEHTWKIAIEKTLEALQIVASNDSKNMLRAYIEISIEHFYSTEEMPAFYMNFYSHSLYDEKIKKLNLVIKTTAAARIAGFLGDQLSEADRLTKAHYIHSSLTGLLLNYCVEKNYEKLIQDKDLLIQEVVGALGD